MALLDLVPAEYVFKQFPVFYGVMDRLFKYLDIKGLGEIHIGAHGQSFNIVVYGRSCSKQDHRDMIYIDVLFDLFAQGDPVGFGHFYVANDQVRIFLQDTGKRLLAIAAFGNMIQGGKLFAEVITDIFIVIYNKNTVPGL